MKMKIDEIGQADNPGGMGGLPGVPVQPTDKLAAVDAAIKQKVEAMNGRYPEKNGNLVVSVPVAGETGYRTSEGVPIESSFRYADDFYNQMGINNILDNTPSGAMSYQGYLAYNGITDPRINYVRSLDRANEMYARSLGTYGASGESLAQGNLVGTGYSEYLNGLAYQNKANMYTAAAQQLSADQRQTSAQYQQYLRDFEKENGINVPGAAQGGTPEEVSVEGSTTVLTPTQQQAYDYLSGNVTVSADIPAAIIAMRSQGLSDADIEAALNNWNAYRTEGINKEIDNVSSLAAGNAAKLKEVYGEGEDYDTALARLQKKNSELVSKAVKAINDGNFDGKDFSAIMNAARENTATTNKKGETEYEWDKMNEEEKAKQFLDVLRDMYESDDIDQATYQKANYDIITETIENASKEEYTFNAGRKRMINILESLGYLINDPELVGEEKSEEIFKSIADRITGRIEVRQNDTNFKFNLDGNRVVLPIGKLTELQEDALEKIAEIKGYKIGITGGGRRR